MDWQDDLIEGWPLPALLRGAGAAYGSAIHRSLAKLASTYLPPSGPYVIGAVGQTTVPLGAIIRQLGISKQAAGQLVDTLVVRGYWHSLVDPTDRRRLVIHLTERESSRGAHSVAVGGRWKPTAALRYGLSWPLEVWPA